jgi:hypothetical protein
LLADGLLGIGSSSSSSTMAAAAAGGQAAVQFRPRLLLVTHDSGVISSLPGPRSDVLLLDVDVTALTAVLESSTKRQQRPTRDSSRTRQQQQHQQGGAGGSSCEARISSSSGSGYSRSASLEVTPRAQSGSREDVHMPVTPGQRVSPSASAGPAQEQQEQPALPDHPTGAFSRQSSITRHSSGDLQQRQPAAAAGRAVLLALQVLCLLHRWGCDRSLDSQLLSLLAESGLLPGGLCRRGSSTSEEVLAAAAAAAVPSCEGGCDAAAPESSWTSCSLMRLWEQLQQYLQDPLPAAPAAAAAAGPPAAGPCLIQEVLQSGQGALVLGLPAALSVQQQQQQQQQCRQDAKAAEYSSLQWPPPLDLHQPGSSPCQEEVLSGGDAAPAAAVLLVASPTLLAARSGG